MIGNMNTIDEHPLFSASSTGANALAWEQLVGEIELFLREAIQQPEPDEQE